LYKLFKQNMKLFLKTSYNISQIITKNYSTSFYITISLLDNETKKAIFSIYGFVRFADEIVDTFHQFDKKKLLQQFENDYYNAIQQEISLNPVLNSFQKTVKKYNIDDKHVQAFLSSMKNDLLIKDYSTKNEVDSYIYGSADVVGLMCLKVFCNGNSALYNELEFSAQKLGSAFQKVNFLRDLKNDIENLDRNYFPNVKKSNFDEKNKREIINDIENDFKMALSGIKKLPNKSKLAVLIAYYYYKNLLKKIRKTPAEKIIKSRIRISNFIKIILLLKAIIKYKLNLT